MELVAIARVLWARRRMVGAGALVAVAAGFLTAYSVSILPPRIESRASQGGAALARVLVDTPRPLVADARVRAAGTIRSRAILLGGLMETDQGRGAIARRAGVDAGDVGVVGPGLDGPTAVTPLAQAASEVTAPSDDYLVVITIDPQISVVSISTRAPDVTAATVLADAAVGELTALAGNQSSGHRRLVDVERLGPPSVESDPAGPGKAKSMATGAVVFVLWCSAVVLLNAGRERRRHGWQAAAPSN